MDKISEIEERDVVVNAHENDEQDMHRMGKRQQFQRNFKTVSITAFTAVAMSGWVFVPVYATALIPVAGTGGAIVFFLVNFFGFLTTVVSLAEMSSIAPTAGGQYHWTSEFAPPKLQKVLSYASGWLSSLAWLVGISSGAFFAGNLVTGLVQLHNPGFTPQPWQGYLVIVGLVLNAFLVNSFLAKHLPFLEGFGFIYYAIDFLVILIVMLVLSPKLTAVEVFQTFTAYGGGMAPIREVLPAQVYIFFALNGMDSAAHLAEETSNASRVIPKVMIWSYCINGLLVFATLLMVCFCWVAPDEYLAVAETGNPFLVLYATATGSTTGAIVIWSVLVTVLVISGLNYTASTSRQVWAFARDSGLPFSKWISKVNLRTKTPINSLLFVSMFIILIDLIGLGSSVALNAIVSLQTLALAATYQVSVLCLIWRRLYGEPLPKSPFSLGKAGLPLNIASVLFSWYLLAYACMPGEYPVTAKNMNWAPVIFGIIVIVSAIYYLLRARKVYEGPVVKVVRS